MPPACCALDAAARAEHVLRHCHGEATLEAVGRALNVTRERLRQIELVALAKVRGALAGVTFDNLAPEPEAPWR